MATRYLRFNRTAGAPLERAPLLEKLLARADSSELIPDWRAGAYAALAPSAPMPGIAAAAYRHARCAGGAIQASGWLAIATPLHYIAEMSDVRLAPEGVLSIDADETGRLTRDFNQVWHDSDFRLEAGATGLFCHAAQELRATQSDPEQVRGRTLHEFLPRGDDAPRLKRLMSEMEIWLHDHAVNRARAARGLAAISGLWLWGGGPPILELPATAGAAAGDDVFFKAFAPKSDQTINVMVMHDSPPGERWRDMESRWLRAALDDLRDGVISRLDVASGSRCIHITKRWRYRVLRRPKAWWEYFD